MIGLGTEVRCAGMVQDTSYCKYSNSNILPYSVGDKQLSDITTESWVCRLDDDQHFGIYA